MHVSYRKAVEWVAYNDDTVTMDVDEVAGYITTALVADLFKKGTSQVAEDIVKFRAKHVNPGEEVLP